MECVFDRGAPASAGQFLIALNPAASPEYFATAGIPILRGRTFTDRDGLGFDDDHLHTGAVVISESMAHEFWPGEKDRWKWSRCWRIAGQANGRGFR
jgi:hypothetical protein